MESTEVRGKVDFGIITILEEEFEAVLECFSTAEVELVRGRQEYNLRRVELPDGDSYLVAVVRCLKQGNIAAQRAAHDLLEDLNPQWVLVVGIAGGIPSGDFGLGDVIVSDEIRDFSVEAVLQDEEVQYALGGGPVHTDAGRVIANLPARMKKRGNWSTVASVEARRPAVPTLKAVQASNKLYGDEHWRDDVLRALEQQSTRSQPRVTVGTIASSDRLIKDTEILKVWKKMARQTRAVEMESAGVYQATLGRVPMLSIRGISDLVGLKREDTWKEYACHTAAAFALALLRTKPFPPVGARQGVLPEDAAETRRKLRKQLAGAHERKNELRKVDVTTSAIDEEILGLRRLEREGGQLREGHALGHGRYLLRRRLGKGGFGTVWEADDTRARQRVAIKVLHAQVADDPTRRDRFFRGARVMSELAHANIVKVLEPYGLDRGFYYFVMEYIPGGDFQEAVLTRKLSREAVIPLVLRVGRALAVAHQRKFTHRDIKPANILLDEQGSPRLTDFDLVGGFDTTGGTRTGPMGTFLYAPPELMGRPQDSDARADVYGLGMTTLFGLYGREFTGDIVYRETRRKDLIDQLPCNAGVKEVLQRAVSLEREERYPDASEFCRALEEAHRFEPPSRAFPPKRPVEVGDGFKAVVAFPSLQAAAEAVTLEGSSIESAPEAQWIRLPMTRQGERLFAVRAPIDLGKQARQPIRQGDWLVMRSLREGGVKATEGDVGLVELLPHVRNHTLAVLKKGEWLVAQGSALRRLPTGEVASPVALLVELIPPERIGPERGAQLAPKTMMEAFGVRGTPKTGRHGGFLFLCISEKGALLEPDRIGLLIGDRRPAEPAFVLTSRDPQHTWRYWGVARWRADESCWSLPKPVDHTTWRELGHGRSSSNRLPAEAELRARAWVEQFLLRHPPGTRLQRDKKYCRIVGRAPRGGLLILGGDGKKERTVSLTDLAWVFVARDDAQEAGEFLDEARVNRFRYLEGTPHGSTRFIDTGWAIFLLENG